MSNGASPILAVLGGSKISSKIPIIENIIDKVDDIIIGGGMSFTFIKALGGKIGSSIHEGSMTEKALSILELAEQKNHHPDISIGWCNVNVSITSHDMGGVTNQCVELANEIDLL